MWKNKDFDIILELVLSRQLGRAISEMEIYFFTRTQQEGRETLSGIKSDYMLLMDYWKKGFEDNQRTELYNKLLQRMYMLVSDTLFLNHINLTYTLSSSYRQTHEGKKDWSVSAIKTELETFISDVALMELESEHTRQEKMKQVYQRHQDYLSSLFNYICTSRQWKESVGKAFEEVILAPTIDVLDQQFIVSAITISTLNVFDFTKFKTLVNVFEKATNEPLRQRALVGWVLSIDAEKAQLYTEITEIVNRLCADEQCRRELVELQIQMVYCMAADDDSKRIKNEIMPDLMKGNNVRFTRQGLVEMEEDQLENILHPDASEKNMEQMEASMKKMADMQKRGSDIYFAGFSQMKRFPFFNNLSNWFMPFYPQHPGVSTIWSQSKGQKFLHTITHLGAFCDSDKYSFVLAFDQVLSHLPSQMLQMIENGEASPMAVGGEVPFEEQHQPAFIRRIYLQNLYRFFRLFPQRSEFCNPFEYPSAIFFSKPVFINTPLEHNMLEVAAFLGKQKMLKEAITLLESMKKEPSDAEYFLLLGQLKMSYSSGTTDMGPVVQLLGQAKTLLSQSDNMKSFERALKGYARATFLSGDYQESLLTYEQLLKIHPDHHNHQLNAAICMVKLGQYEEAMKILYKLNYEDADDYFVNSTMAWTLTLTGKFEQAKHIYNQLLARDQKNDTDYLNYGYCLWFQRDITGAVSLFRQFINMQDNGFKSFKNDVLKSEHAIIKERGISDVEIQLMLDAVSS